jgi:hypothetical protein
VRKISPTTWIGTPDSSGRSKSLYRLTYLCDLEGGHEHKLLRRENGIKLLQMDTKRFTKHQPLRKVELNWRCELPYEQKHEIFFSQKEGKRFQNYVGC